MIFYIKEGESYVEATDDQVLTRFKERIDRIKSSEAKKVREELETTVRDELTPKITKELEKDLTKTLTEKLEGDYKSKLQDAEKKVQENEVKIRQKTLAAEYGFKPDMESFLGTGTEDEMRANADKLKENVGVVTSKPPEKETTPAGATSGLVTKVS